MAHREISPYEIKDNTFTALDRDWMLICAPDKTKACGANAMTASWGGLGFLWYKPVATLYVRPQRYTYSLTEESDRVSLCFFDEEYRDALKLCGTKSGRDMDKLGECGLSVSSELDTPIINEARMILVCRKLYADNIKEECFTDNATMERAYPKRDYHRFYICEIEKVLIKE